MLFSSASDGTAPAGTLAYSYVSTTRTLNILFDLTPGAYYNFTSTLLGNLLTVTLTPTGSSVYQVSSQGVLNFILEANAKPLINQMYLPLVMRNSP